MNGYLLNRRLLKEGKMGRKFIFMISIISGLLFLLSITMGFCTVGLWLAWKFLKRSMKKDETD